MCSLGHRIEGKLRDRERVFHSEDKRENFKIVSINFDKMSRNTTRISF